MNTLFVFVLILLATIIRIIVKKRMLITDFINIGYIISLTGCYNLAFSIQYYVFVFFTIISFYFFEIVFFSFDKKMYNPKVESKIFLPLLIINIISFFVMFFNFYKRYGFLNPLRYGHLYENYLYMPGWTLLYRSAVPLFIYAVYKIIIDEKRSFMYYFTIVYVFITLFIKFNKTDVFVLLISVLITLYYKYFYESKKYIKKIMFILTAFIFFWISYLYFNYFYLKIFSDSMSVNLKFFVYLSGGQIYLNYKLMNNLWNRFEYFNFLNILKGYVKPDRVNFLLFSTNVYGLFGDIFDDFNYFGIVIGPFVIISIYKLLNKLVKNNILIFIFFATYFTLAFFNPYFLLKEFWVQIIHLVIIIRFSTLYRLAFRKK